MTTYRLVMCPYDEVHKVKENRLQNHISKCKLNHLNTNKFICPFNSTHVYPCQDRDYHLSNCPDRAPLDRSLAEGSLERNNPYRGRTAVPSYNESPVAVSDEVWDLDSNPTPGYRPPSETPSGVMFTPPPFSKPAERRRMYENLHLRPDEDENRPGQPAAAAASPVVPKQPSGPSKLKSLHNSPNLGKVLGRGTSKRIAANIFTEQNKPGSTNGHSYDVDAVSSNISQLGRGASNHAIAPNQQNEDEFPALGSGRGLTRVPRNISYAGILGAGNKQ